MKNENFTKKKYVKVLTKAVTITLTLSELLSNNEMYLTSSIIAAKKV